MKYLKGLSRIFLIAFLLIPTVIPSVEAKGQTLGDLKTQLKKMEDDYAQNKQDQNLTQQQINETNQKIEQITKDVNQIHIDMVKLTEEIAALNVKISEKDKEIKEIINFVQVANGESAYMEYAFGAKDFTDFIYRMAISEQLSNYNDKLIKEYHDMIEQNNQKSKQLKQKENDLATKQKQLTAERSKLGNKLKSIIDIKVSIEDDIKSQKDAIKFYQEDLGCKDEEELSICGREKLPSETSFWRPVNVASISSDYGNRCFWLNGEYTCDFHTGIDMAKSGDANPVYAIGKGVVADTVQWNCGGRIIFINHKINNVNYTSVYMHLRKILVSKGDVVTKNTQIGVMGGDPNRETWDDCSSGQHTHLTLSYGLYTGWSGVINGLVNPRNLINFPSGYGSFTDRITKY